MGVQEEGMEVEEEFVLFLTLHLFFGLPTRLMFSWSAIFPVISFYCNECMLLKELSLLNNYMIT